MNYFIVIIILCIFIIIKNILCYYYFCKITDLTIKYIEKININTRNCFYKIERINKLFYIYDKKYFSFYNFTTYNYSKICKHFENELELLLTYY